MTKNRRMKQNPQKGKRMAVNVREIAKKANVSAATVSRVLHQSEQVKPETRKKVEEAMTGKPVKCHGIGKRLMQAASMQKERRKKDGKL